MPAARCAGSLGRRIFLLELEDSCVGLVGHPGEEQQVVAAEASGALPFIAVFVGAVDAVINMQSTSSSHGIAWSLARHSLSSS